MRSELVFGAMTHVSNRFLLTRVAAKATRRFHRPNTRIEDTANEVFERFAQCQSVSRRVLYQQPAVVPLRCAG